MDEQEYLTSRLDDQLDWYERKANTARRRYKVLRAIEFTSAAFVPIAVVLGTTIYHRIAAAGLGALAAAASGFQSVNRYQENWVEYRAVAEQLKSERFAFLTRTAPYDGEDRLGVLVENVERLFGGEHASWGDRMHGASSAKGRPDYTGF
jgi:hypothetical protein